MRSVTSFFDQWIDFVSNCRHQEGTYECIANNGVGSPATTHVQVQVLCEYFSLIPSFDHKSKYILCECFSLIHTHYQTWKWA